MTLATEIEAAERAVWDALVRGDAGADWAALSRDFLGVYPTGFAGADDHAGQLADGPTVAAYRLSECLVRGLGADHALIAYRADYARPGDGAAEETMFVTSIWRRAGGAGWINVFSQDTPAGGAVP
ncbi:DUF4440 domain-containing protein [Rhodobacterales bacterium HKCCE2091]|nr:DUF4440 domain-containing protein [Rhodobacterales bacterium HKCCE2091]